MPERSLISHEPLVSTFMSNPRRANILRTSGSLKNAFFSLPTTPWTSTVRMSWTGVALPCITPRTPAARKHAETVHAMILDAFIAVMATMKAAATGTRNRGRVERDVSFGTTDGERDPITGMENGGNA